MTEVPTKRSHFTILPNSVLLYKDLSNDEIACYSWLKMICGEKGVCYRTLRKLSEMTRFSVGHLSEMIRDLHNKGLIHAEKKKLHDQGWPIWHISIVDIWQENARLLAKSGPNDGGDGPGNGSSNEQNDTRETTNGSSDEQSEREHKETVRQMNDLQETLQEANESVHDTNALPENPSPSEPNCSLNASNKDSVTKNLNPDKDPNYQEPIAPTGAEVVFDQFENNEDSASPEESAWSSEGIQNIAACFLSPLPLMRKEQREEAETNWQMAAERICSHSTWICHDDEKRPQLLTGLLQFVTAPDSPCSYRKWWLANIGDLAKLRLWHIADNLYRLYQDYMSSSWQPQSSDQAEEVPTPQQEARPAPVIDTEPEPTVTPEPVVTPAAESLPALTLEEAKTYTARIRAERDWYSVQCYQCASGFYLEAAVTTERIHRIDSQASFGLFMHKTRRRTLAEVQEEMARRRQQLKAS